jgi:hypothetical protein
MECTTGLALPANPAVMPTAVMPTAVAPTALDAFAANDRKKTDVSAFSRFSSRRS